MDIIIMPFNSKMSGFLILLCCLLTLSFSCHALYTSVPHGFCSENPDNITSSFIRNRNEIIDSLAQNITLRNGFSIASAEENSTTIYALLQCRANISSQNCSNCADRIAKQLKDPTSCSINTTDSAIMMSNCFLRYSIENFTARPEEDSLKNVVGWSERVRDDDPEIVSRGNEFIRNLASTAPNQPLMFKEGILDIGGDRGTRYGFVQCRRDLNVSTCDQCLNALANEYVTKFEYTNETTWEISSFGCTIWYRGETRASQAFRPVKFEFSYVLLLFVLLLIGF